MGLAGCRAARVVALTHRNVLITVNNPPEHLQARALRFRLIAVKLFLLDEMELCVSRARMYSYGTKCNDHDLRYRLLASAVEKMRFLEFVTLSLLPWKEESVSVDTVSFFKYVDSL